MYPCNGNIAVYKGEGVGMSADLKVVYLLDSVEVKRNMTQLQLADLLKNDDVLLLSVNAPTVKHYRRKKKGGKSVAK